MIRVQVFQPDGQPVMRSFSKNEVLIGRKPNNDIILAGQDVSGTHACLQVENGRVTLVDLGSTNGTFVNSERVQVSAQLSPADEIKISVFTLHVSVGDDRSAQPSPPWDGPVLPGPTSPHPVVSSDPAPRRIPTPSPSPRATPSPHATPDHQPPPPIRRGATPAPSDDLPPPVLRNITPAPSDDLPPPVRRSSLDDTLNPRPPWPSGPTEGDGPPVVARARPHSTARAAPQKLPPAADPDAPPIDPVDLEQAWADPTVRRIIIAGLHRIEVERDGVCLPLARGFASVDELGDRLAALCGRPILRDSPTECVLASGTAVQAILDGDRGPQVVITRPRSKRPGGLDALVQDRALPTLASDLLVACARARLPLLIVARAGVCAAPLLSALLAALEGSTGLVRGLPAPAVPPRDCVAIDAGHGSGHMAAAVRLLLATEVAWLAVDEPEPAALDECAWASADGRGLLVGMRAASLEQALARAHATAAPPVSSPQSSGPAIPYALAVVLEPPVRADHAEHVAPTPAAFLVTRIIELRGGEQDLREIFSIGRRGELIPIAVPAILAELAQRGVHIAPELFTPA